MSHSHFDLKLAARLLLDAYLAERDTVGALLRKHGIDDVAELAQTDAAMVHLREELEAA